MMTKMLKQFFVALQFLTRLKLVRQDAWEPADFGGSVKFFPLVGLIIGLMLAGLYEGGVGHLRPHTLAAALLAGEVLVTGGLHLDGFMDTLDGIFSGRSRVRMLEIMKDSRVGANGVMGLGVLLVVKWSLLLDMPAAYMPAAVLYMPLVSRWVQVGAITFFPYARPEGMGKAFACYAGRFSFVVASILSILALLPGGLPAYSAAVAAFLCSWGFIRHVLGKIGGLTGDVYGAVTELSEIVVLAAYNFM